MKDNIINILKNSDKALSVFEIEDLLGVKDVESTKEILKTLHELEEETVIYHSNKDKYMMLENSHLRRGIMRGNKRGFGFVEVENSDDDIFILENRIKEAKPISQMLEEKMSLEDIAKDITGDTNIELVEENNSAKYECSCSKERMEEALISIGRKDLSKIIEEDKKAEIICHFCNQKYEFNEDELRKLYDNAN